MARDYKELEISDTLFDLGELVFKEEVTILAPYLRDMMLKANEAADHGKDDKDQSGPVRQG
jgi:hypothetical protein